MLVCHTRLHTQYTWNGKRYTNSSYIMYVALFKTWLKQARTFPDKTQWHPHLRTTQNVFQMKPQNFICKAHFKLNITKFFRTKIAQHQCKFKKLTFSKSQCSSSVGESSVPFSSQPCLMHNQQAHKLWASSRPILGIYGCKSSLMYTAAFSCRPLKVKTWILMWTLMLMGSQCSWMSNNVSTLKT